MGNLAMGVLLGTLLSAEVSTSTAKPHQHGPPAPVMNGSAQLSWQGVAEATGYKVYRGTQHGVYQFVADVGAITAWFDPVLTSGTVYYYVVTAYNAGGESGYSNEAFKRIP